MPKHDLKAQIQEILRRNSTDELDSIIETFNKEVAGDEELFNKKARAMLDAYLEDDANAFCLAITGWSVQSILAMAGVIPDTEGVRL